MVRGGFAARPRSFLCALAALLLSACGGGSSPSNPGNASGLAQTVDAVVQAEMRQSGVPGISVELAKQGTLLYAKGYGQADLSSGQPVGPGTVFEIGSITKQFTAALILKLQEQQKLSVNDPLAKYLPEYQFPPGITLRMLLNHTSGLADFTNFPQLGPWVKHGVSEQTILTAVAQAGLQFQPGTQYQYSNSNFFALGTIIERITNQSYASYLQQSIFQPLGLHATYYDLPPAGVAAAGYANNGMGIGPAIIWDRSAAFATGALSSDLADLVAWDHALVTGSVVSPASFQQMIQSNGFTIDGQGDSYGFGLGLSRYNNRPLIWHSGQIGGFTAENVVFLDNEFTLVVLTNDQDFNTDPLVYKILNAVCGSASLSGTC
jgi:CubicO group peptidase (beta-lactamase class C family)